MSISVNNLSKNYGSQKAVNQISFTVNKGEIVGFLGPNGAGKSTTMKMITGYLHADSGDINICGIPVKDNNLDTKKKIGYLPEANPLYVEMYVREYLELIAGIHQIKNPGFTINEVIKTVGLSPESKKKIGQLSKGYKQRVGLAAALVHDPEVLILDEPTSGLDPNQIIEIRAVIKSLAVNKTVLFSSHIMQEVEAICDRVIIIDKGQIVADDQLSNLQGNNSTQQVVMVEFKEKVDINLLRQFNISEITAETGYVFHIKSNDPGIIRRQLLEFSVIHHLNIISLQTQSQSLESIFRSLTS